MPYRPEKKRFVYVVQCGPYWKIGIANCMAVRLSNFRVHNPYPVKVVFELEVRDIDAPVIEKRAHELLRRFHHHGEWFEAEEEHIRDAMKASVLEAEATEHTRKYEWASFEQTRPETTKRGKTVESPTFAARRQKDEIRKANKIKMMARLEKLQNVEL